ncbi:hypothetical protein ABFS82_03G058000 [Erythranthe guttata]
MAGHHLIKYIFLCWRGDGTAFWPGSPLRLCVVPLFFRFGHIQSHIQSLRHFNFQQLIGLVTNIIVTKKLYPKITTIASKFSEQAYSIDWVFRTSAHREFARFCGNEFDEREDF